MIVLLPENSTKDLEKVAWYDGISFNYSLMAVCALLFLSALIWPLGYYPQSR